MKLSFTSISLLCAFLICSNANAQFQGQVYKPSNKINVYAYNQLRTLAWCGGFDNPQFAMGDLNHDGKQDLVIYERGIGVRTFLNMSNYPDGSHPDYRFAPEYTVTFPPIDGFCKLEDYNCDGIPDLISGGDNFLLWKGYYNSKSQLCFTFYEALYYNNDPGASGWQNAYCSPSDIPAVVDVDHDGDLDFLAYDVLYGTHIQLYKNMRVELALPCDSVVVNLKDKCWGRVYQGTTLTHLLHVYCDNSGLKPSSTEKKTHTGNAMCLFDHDGDGDWDYLDGSIGFDSLVFLQNGKVPYSSPDSMVYEDTTWQRGGHRLYMPHWPAAFNVDIDQDGQKDILVSPNTKGENYKCIAYYRNTGTASAPVFTYQDDTLLIDKTIDIGTGAYPMFFDYNKDGKPDLFIGSDGYYQNGQYYARISYYMNTSVLDTPSFTLQTADFMGLSSKSYKGAATAVGDIDNDGKADLVIGHNDGTFSYYTNTAASDSVQPNWQLSEAVMKDVDGNTMTTGANAAPFIYDMNKDGKPDLISGNYIGYVQYYENTSTTPGTLSMKKITTQLGGVKVDGPYPGQYTSTPFIGKIDNSNIDYMLVGSYSGEIYRYDGFQGGNTTVPYTLLDSNYSYIDSAYLLIHRTGNYRGFRSAPAVADVDGDGKYEMVIGDTYGGVMLYEQDTTVYVSVNNLAPDNEIKIYPNPTSNIVNISWNAAFSQKDVTITLITTTGQKVVEKIVTGSDQHALLNTQALAPGIYYCILQSENNRKVLPVTIMK